MASFKEMERGRAEREQRETVFREYALNKYGEELGTAFYDYLHGNPRTEEEQEEKEIAFANAISASLNSQDPIKMSLGIAAVLESTRMLIAPVARRAMNAHLRTAPIG